jgi:potassium/hydrogen antiporter
VGGVDEAASAFTVEQLAPVLAVGALVLVVAVGAVRLSVRSGLPSLLLYLFLGVALGDAGLGIPFESMGLSRVLGYVALILILAEGGLTTSWHEIRGSVAPAAVLSTLGVTASVLVVAVAAKLVLPVDWTIALLIGAILSSTDAAAVFSVLRRVPLPPRLTGMLEAESGFNDAPVVLLTVALSQQAARTDASAVPLWVLILTIVAELIGGSLIGLAVGYLGSQFMRRMASASAGLFPLGVMGWVVLAYGAAAMLHTSGFIAVYLAALVLGNTHLPHRASYRGFAAATGWLAQIGLFVMLGLLVSPDDLLPQLWPALVLGTVLLLIARPVSVWISTVWFGMSWREQGFLSWAGLRGAVPIVLATVPVLVGVPNITWLFNLVFVLVVVFTLVQAPVLPRVAAALRVIDPERAVNLEVEATPLEELGADLLDVRVGPTSRLHGIELFELRLPPGAEVTMVVRDGRAFVPDPHTVLNRGDHLLVVATIGTRTQAELRLHAVDERGRLAGWSGLVPVERDQSEQPPSTSRMWWRLRSGPNRWI